MATTDDVTPNIFGIFFSSLDVGKEGKLVFPAAAAAVCCTVCCFMSGRNYYGNFWQKTKKKTVMIHCAWEGGEVEGGEGAALCIVGRHVSCARS